MRMTREGGARTGAGRRGWGLGTEVLALVLVAGCSGDEEATRAPGGGVSQVHAAEGGGFEDGNRESEQNEAPRARATVREASNGRPPRAAREDLSLEELERMLDAIPRELAPVLDPELAEEGDPEGFPHARSIGGAPVEIVREREKIDGSPALVRIVTVLRGEREETGRPQLHGPEWFVSPSGAVRGSIWWRNDVRHGPVKRWREDGTLQLEGGFYEGQRDGLRREYDETGRRLRESRYVDGRREGTFRQWYPSGTLREEASYRADRYHGRRRVWNEAGVLVQDETYRRGVRHGLWSDFDPETGTPRTWGSFDDGERSGLWREGTPEGRIVGERNYRSGRLDGEVRRWTPGGTLVEVTRFDGGEKTGPSRAWYEDGTPRSEGRYEDGAREGRWLYWRENGGLNDAWSGEYSGDRRVAPLSADDPARGR